MSLPVQHPELKHYQRWIWEIRFIVENFPFFGCSQYLRRVLSVVIWLRPIQRTDINERCLMKFSDLVLESTYLKCVHIRTPRKSQLSSLFFMFSQPTVLVFNDLRHEALYTASDEALFSPSLVWLVSYTRAPAFMVLSEAWSALLPFRRTVERCAAPAHGRAVPGSFDRRITVELLGPLPAAVPGRATGHARPHAGLTGSGVAGRTDTNGPKGPWPVYSRVHASATLVCSTLTTAPVQFALPQPSLLPYASALTG